MSHPVCERLLAILPSSREHFTDVKIVVERITTDNSSLALQCHHIGPHRLQLALREGNAYRLRNSPPPSSLCVSWWSSGLRWASPTQPTHRSWWAWGQARGRGWSSATADEKPNTMRSISTRGRRSCHLTKKRKKKERTAAVKSSSQGLLQWIRTSRENENKDFQYAFVMLFFIPLNIHSEHPHYHRADMGSESQLGNLAEN